MLKTMLIGSIHVTLFLILKLATLENSVLSRLIATSSASCYSYRKINVIKNTQIPDHRQNIVFKSHGEVSVKIHSQEMATDLSHRDKTLLYIKYFKIIIDDCDYIEFSNHR